MYYLLTGRQNKQIKIIISKINHFYTVKTFLYFLIHAIRDSNKQALKQESTKTTRQI